MQTMREQTVALAKALGVVGLINVQYAIKNGVVYVLEVNPRASRTIPFVSKAIGVPLASLAARVMIGETLDEIGFTEEIVPPYVSVKEAVFPFNKFPGTDPMLGPEMRSTGEVMGISDSFGSAFAKGAARGVERAAARGRRADHGDRFGQADGDADRATLPRDGLQHHGDGRDGGVPARARHSGAARVQGARGTPELPRHDRESATCSCSSTRRWESTRSCDDYLAAPGGDREPRVVHDDDVGRERRVRRDSVAPLATTARAVAPGVAGAISPRRADASTRSARRMSDDAFIHESAYVDDGAVDRRRHEDLALLSRHARRGHRRALQPRAERRRDERHAHRRRTARSRTTCRSTRAWSWRTTCSADRRWCSRT